MDITVRAKGGMAGVHRVETNVRELARLLDRLEAGEAAVDAQTPPLANDLARGYNADMKDPITTAEAAEIIGIDPSQVRRYCQRGDLTAKRVGRDWMIERQAAKDFQPAPVGPPRKDRKSKKKSVPPID